MTTPSAPGGGTQRAGDGRDRRRRGGYRWSLAGGEKFFCVRGGSRNSSNETARMLGVRYRQNAVVWAGEDAVPKLVLLR